MKVKEKKCEKKGRGNKDRMKKKKRVSALTRVLWSVLSLSLRFLRVFRKPLDFGFSSLAAG